MTVYYVRNAGSNTAPYDTWAKAATSLAVVTAIPVAAADTVWVADDHAESLASGQTWTCPTTPGLKILCANTHVTAPPTGVGTGAVCATTTTNTQAMTGYAYIYGITFQAGSGGSTSSISIGIAGTAAIGLVLDTCTLYLGSSSSGSSIAVGANNSGGVGTGSDVRLINCVIREGHVSQVFRLNIGNIYISGLSFHASSTVPTTLFNLGVVNAGPGYTTLENSDLSGKAFTNLCTVNAIGNASHLDVRNCKLPASIVVATGTFANYGSQRVTMHNCDSADTHVRLAEHSYAGVVTSSTTITRTSGAVSDDTQGFSWTLTGTANTSILYPLRSPELMIWNDTIGSVTATVEFIRDSVTNLTDAEVWIEACYMSASGFPLGTLITDRTANVAAAGADQAASSVTWANAMANPNKQAASVTFTTAEVGYILARVHLGANTAINIDPVITLT